MRQETAYATECSEVGGSTPHLSTWRSVDVTPGRPLRRHDYAAIAYADDDITRRFQLLRHERALQDMDIRHCRHIYVYGTPLMAPR